MHASLAALAVVVAFNVSVKALPVCFGRGRQHWSPMRYATESKAVGDTLAELKQHLLEESIEHAFAMPPTFHRIQRERRACLQNVLETGLASTVEIDGIRDRLTRVIVSDVPHRVARQSLQPPRDSSSSIEDRLDIAGESIADESDEIVVDTINDGKNVDEDDAAFFNVLPPSEAAFADTQSEEVYFDAREHHRGSFRSLISRPFKACFGCV
jgi:hypothetical protein